MRWSLISLVVLCTAVTPALGQSAFPSKPVTPVVVDNRAGAARTIGSGIFAKALPDGHTLLFGSLATHALGPALYPKIQYDGLKDFSPITQVTSAPLVFASSATIPATSVARLIAMAKSKPGTLNYASTGVGTADHLAGALFAATTGVNVVHVPNQDGAEAKTALVTGESSYTITIKLD